MIEFLNTSIAVKFGAEIKKRYYGLEHREIIEKGFEIDYTGMLKDTGTPDINKREVNPNTATVIIENPKYPYKKGDRVFLHYMAKENEEPIEIDGETCSVIDGMFVFFKTEDDGIVMNDDIFLGEQVYLEEPKTESGIYITSNDKAKDVLKVRILHAPEFVTNEVYGTVYKRKPDAKVGDVIITIDDFQYPLEYEGKEYIMLRQREIVAKLEEV